MGAPRQRKSDTHRGKKANSAVYSRYYSGKGESTVIKANPLRCISQQPGQRRLLPTAAQQGAARTAASAMRWERRVREWGCALPHHVCVPQSFPSCPA